MCHSVIKIMLKLGAHAIAVHGCSAHLHTSDPLNEWWVRTTCLRVQVSVRSRIATVYVPKVPQISIHQPTKNEGWRGRWGAHWLTRSGFETRSVESLLGSLASAQHSPILWTPSISILAIFICLSLPFPLHTFLELERGNDTGCVESRHNHPVRQNLFFGGSHKAPHVDVGFYQAILVENNNRSSSVVFRKLKEHIWNVVSVMKWKFVMPWTQ